MTIIKSRILQLFFVTMAILMLGMVIVSYLYVESEKFKTMIGCFVVSLILLIASTSVVKYDNHCIIMKLFLFEK